MKQAAASETEGSAAGSMNGSAERNPTLTAFARRHGRGKATASRWKRDGLVAFDADGRVDVRDTEAMLAAAGRIEGRDAMPAKGAASEAPGTSDATLDALGARLAAGDMLSIAEAERVKQNYLARLRQLEYATKAQQMVDVAAVTQVVAQRFSRVRNRLLAMPQSAAPRLAHQDARTVGDQLFEEVRAILEELSGQRGQDASEDVAKEAMKHGRR